MAILDAYADRDDYRAKVSDKQTGADSDLDADLLNSSRLLDLWLELHPGGFNSHEATYTFSTPNGPVLWLRDRGGYAYFLQDETTSIGVDSEEDGTFDGDVLSLSNGVIGLPENAPAQGRPYTHIELLDYASLITFTRRSAGVRITGTWGWATVPGIIVDLTVHVAHDLRESHQGGVTLDIPSPDLGGLPFSDQTWRFWRDAKRAFTRYVPRSAAV